MRGTQENIMEKTYPAIEKKIIDFSAFLARIKAESETYDRTTQQDDAAISIIKKLERKYFPEIDSHFERLWDMIVKVAPDERQEIQALFNKHLLAYFHSTPLNQRIIDKPLGYDGDYITMGYYYRNGYEGNTIFDKLIHRYTLHIPVAQSVIFRFAYFYKLINDTYKENIKDRKIKITSLGSGPAIEILNVLSDHISPTVFEFCCVDSDPNAIEQVKSNVSELSKKRNIPINFAFLNMNVLKFIKFSRRNDILQGQHLIYAGGLFDYLNAKTATALINSSFDLLTKRGKLVITNFRKNIPSRAYLENIGGWFLLLRDEKDMLDLCKDIASKAEISVDVDRETETNLYLTIQKK